MIKGKKIDLVPATLEDRYNVYVWCFRSETTRSHSGPPDYPENPIPTYEKFCEDYYEEYFFTGTRPEDGRGFLIVNAGEAVGFISYSSFHLKSSISELDIWMSSEANCGKGYGTDAVRTLGDYLNREMHIRALIMGPSRRNTRAIRSYEKAGFTKSDRAMRTFLLEEYMSLYGDGDYGTEGTAVMVKTFEE